ncbi:hypothetical protein AB0C28_01005 [Nonomuraea sp. NPDC048892]|uniref:hypothetical protein n=1 Tax=Nonomuraea sp. NPDC048892 TaxID=3154624 RepID=UPI000A775511
MTPTVTKKPKPIKPMKPCFYDHGHHEPCQKAPCYPESSVDHGHGEACGKDMCYSETSIHHGYRETCGKGMCYSETSIHHGYREGCDREAVIHEPCNEKPCFEDVKYRSAGAQRLALAPAPKLVRKNLRVTG